MDAQKEVFALVEAVSAARPFQHAKVAEAARAELDVDDARSNAYFIVWNGEGQETSLVSHAEVRVPTGKGSTKDGLVILTFREEPGGAVTESAVWARWGNEPEVRPPNPTGPRTLPVHYLYRLPWGTLSFGFSRGEPARLVEVVLDATGSK